MSGRSTIHETMQRRLREIEAAGLLRTRRTVEPLGEGRCRVNGRDVWDFSSNDYLGLAQHPHVQQATCEAVQTWGAGARASMLISGWTPAHQQLVDTLARFEQTEASLIFSSGYAACMGTIATLVDKQDVIFCDKLNHACLVDGCRLSGAKLRVYRHDQLDILERELQKSHDSGSDFTGQRWIITETLFGMDGAMADLPRLLELAEQYDAALICDEAHGTGVYGPGGRGLIAELLHDRPDLTDVVANRVAARLGTMSKAIGVQGGFVIGSQTLIQLLWNTARPAMFSTGISIANAAAAAAAIETMLENESGPAELRERSRQFRERMQNLGLEVLGEPDCPIVPLVIEDPRRTIRWAGQLEEAGFLVGAVRPPTVPRNTSRLRISLSLAHPEQAIDELAAALDRLNREGMAA